jgi:hypothetical protein
VLAAARGGRQLPRPEHVSVTRRALRADTCGYNQNNERIQ